MTTFEQAVALRIPAMTQERYPRLTADQQLAERAGEIKARHAMPLADCFAAALAKQHRAELYTGDPEFHAVEKDVRIVWLPQGAPPA